MNADKNHRLKRKACTRCATAKARCFSTGAAQGCDRCRRLRRECILEEVPRRKKVKQSTGVKALEEKVNTLLTLLGPHAPVDTRTPALTEDNCSPICQSAKSTATSVSVDESQRFDVIESGVLDMPMADTLLHKYRRVYSKFFPFVIVSPEVDATTLRLQSPFLFLAIMTSTFEGDHMLQRRLGVDIKKILCERVIVGNERNLDLLQGLLVHLSWSHFHFNPQKKHLYMLLHMAIAMMTDLDLDRCPAHRDQRVASNLCCPPTNANMLGQGKLPAQPECRRTPAEIRALLGCFYISSSMAMMRKELVMSHTDWIDNCCHILETEQEAATDIDAIAFVRIRCLVQDVGDRFSYGDPTTIKFQNDTVIQMTLNGLKKEIEKLEASPALSPARRNYALIAELKALPITMNEVALYRDYSAASSSSAQVSRLWDLLTSARDFLRYAQSIPNEVMVDLPATTFNLLTYALIVLSTVSRLPSTTGWDSSIVKREADATNFGLQIKARFGDELSKTAQDLPVDEKDVWRFFSRGIGGLVAWHQKCEMSSGAEIDIHIPISGGRCGMADTMTAFTNMWFRKPVMPATSMIREHMAAPVAAPNDNRTDIQPDALDIWDEEAWQSILDDFSMFPTTAGFPV